jgi:WD40 repeat protein
VRVWDASTGAAAECAGGPHRFRYHSVAFSRDGMRIVSGSADKTVRVWDASTGVVLNVLKGHAAGVQSVAFSTDGMRVVSGSEDESVRVWDVSTTSSVDFDRKMGETELVAFPGDGTHSSDFETGHRHLPRNLTETNWVISQRQERLMWVPPEANLKLPNNTLIISCHGFGTVDFEQAKIGLEWVDCYTP